MKGKRNNQIRAFPGGILRHGVSQPQPALLSPVANVRHGTFSCVCCDRVRARGSRSITITSRLVSRSREHQAQPVDYLDLAPFTDQEKCRKCQRSQRNIVPNSFFRKHRVMRAHRHCRPKRKQSIMERTRRHACILQSFAACSSYMAQQTNGGVQLSPGKAPRTMAK